MNRQQTAELDAWIAEHVFKMKVLKTKTLVCFHDNEARNYDAIYDTREKYCGVWIWGAGDSIRYNPTHNPALAIEVLKKCIDRHMVTLWKTKLSEHDQYVLENKTSNNGNTLEADQDLCIAICKYARQLNWYY